MWSEFDTDVQALLAILQKKICEMGDRAEGQKNIRFQVTDKSHERLNNVVTVEGTNNMEEEYISLYSIVRNTPLYSPIFVTADDIDTWKPAKDKNQSYITHRQ